MRVCCLSLLLIAPLAAASEPGPEIPAAEGAGIVATVNGEPVFFEDLERGLSAMHSGQAPTQRGAFDVDQLMFRLVNDTLLAQEARVLGMQEEEPIPSKLDELSQDLALKRLEFEEIGKGAEPTEEELRRAFERDYRTITLRTLTCREREEAEAVLEELDQGADFEALIKERSIDDRSQRGGLIEKLDRIDTPNEIAEVGFASSPGQIAGPVRTGLGWAVIRTEAVADADPERYETLERKLREVERLRKAEALRTDLGARLRQLHEISVDGPLLESIVAERISDGRLMPQIASPDAVVASVGGRVITAQELGQALMKRWRGVANAEAADATRPLVLDRLIRDQLMIAEAERRGYADSPTAQRARAAFEKQLLVPRFLTEVVLADVEVTEEEAKAFYDENLDVFRRPPRVHVGQITVAEPDQAREMAELLRQGTDLAWLARQHSIDGLKESGGDKGWIVPQRRFSALHDALFGAEPGAVLGPMGVPGNYTVVRVNAVEDQGHYSFEEAQGRARAGVADLKYQQTIDEFIRKLRSRSEITINEAILASMRITGAQVEEEAAPPGHGH